MFILVKIVLNNPDKSKNIAKGVITLGSGFQRMVSNNMQQTIFDLIKANIKFILKILNKILTLFHVFSIHTSKEQ